MLDLQDYLCRRADKHLIPKVDNTNVDRSVAAIHATVLGCLRQQSRIAATSAGPQVSRYLDMCELQRGSLQCACL